MFSNTTVGLSDLVRYESPQKTYHLIDLTIKITNKMHYID